MKFKIILAITMLISLTGCKGVNQYITDSVYNLKNGGSDEYFAKLKNIEIKEKCKSDTQTKITCIQTLLYKREEARVKLNLPKLYEDNSDAKKVYASRSEDYIQKPVITKSKPTISSKNTNIVSNNNSSSKNESANKQVSQTKSTAPKITDFANNTVLLNDMYYSTTKKDISHSGFIMKCADGMMIDAMNIWKKRATEENQLKEFSLLRDRIYTAQWNAALDGIESNLTKDKETIANTIFMCKILTGIQKSIF